MFRLIRSLFRGFSSPKKATSPTPRATAASQVVEPQEAGPAELQVEVTAAKPRAPRKPRPKTGAPKAKPGRPKAAKKVPAKAE